MKSFFAATVILCGFSLPVYAGNPAPVIVEQVVIAAPVVGPVDRGGLYLGIVGGSVTGLNFWSTGDETGGSLPGVWSGTPIGITLGINYQISNAFVIGVEGDYSFTEASALSLESGNFICGNGPGCETNLNNIATLRGRVGLSFGNLMVFGTAGYGMADAVGSIADGAVIVGEAPVSGVVWGGGVELALGDNWSAKIEYLDVEMGRLALSNGCNINCFTDIGYQTIRFGINRQF